jgi:hypothetical protein
MEWHALKIMKYHNVFYCRNIATQGLLKQSFKKHLQFEINCLKLYLLNEEDMN